MLFDLYI